ncbi:class I SAM-dependent methyltransferase [Arthrobacter sp. ES3-54]|uniref:class I SAM-dependent methyltransferase n=1 Tax=Arthrobacter sp. ES3-54 TaxID=1502991 RepID=UPI002404CC78|nr:class I SAM-dependent methyltransferase [Arthrobacter sp. ES3-54]
MDKAADTLRLVAKVAALSLHRPRRPDRRWDAFWRGVSLGSLSEPIIWDAAPGAGNEEIRHHLQAMANAMDTRLPLIDLGCGNGAITRRLTEIFPSVLGVDVSPEAVAAAQSAHPHVPGLSFRRLDATQPAAAAGLWRELGDTNVFVRGVFHVLSRRRQARLAGSIEALLGTQGRIYLVETNVPGGALSYLRGLGATGEKIPGPLRQAISALPKPGHFGTRQRSRVFPADRWTLIAEGATVLKTVPMETGGPPGSIPAYWAVLAPRPQTSGPQTAGKVSTCW